MVAKKDSTALPVTPATKPTATIQDIVALRQQVTKACLDICDQKQIIDIAIPAYEADPQKILALLRAIEHFNSTACCLLGEADGRFAAMLQVMAKNADQKGGAK